MLSSRNVCIHLKVDHLAILMPVHHHPPLRCGNAPLLVVPSLGSPPHRSGVFGMRTAVVACMQVLAEGSGRWLVTIWVVLEHSIALAALLIWLVIPSVPAEVQEALDRVQFQRDREVLTHRHNERLRIVSKARSATVGPVEMG
jgi:hypothetical protein